MNAAERKTTTILISADNAAQDLNLPTYTKTISETAIKEGNQVLADQKLKIALKLKKWAWVLCVLTVIFSLASIVLDEIDPSLSEHLEKIMITAFGFIG